MGLCYHKPHKTLAINTLTCGRHVVTWRMLPHVTSVYKLLISKFFNVAYMADIATKRKTMSNEIRVFDTDSIETTAKKIYEDFVVGQSCTVKGLELKEGAIIGGKSMICKGEEVIKELERLDRLENVYPVGKKMSRKRKKLPNTVGGFVAHKIFGWKAVTIDSDIRYQIWRIQ